MDGDTNFRNDLKLLYSSYKERSASYRPPNLKEVRALLKTIFPYVESDNCEADDLISRYQFRGRKDQSFIVVTEDKDAKQTPGHLYNPRKMKIQDCSGFGKLELITKVNAKGVKTYKIDGYGRLWFYYQIVCGDKVDTYHPFPKVVSDKTFYEAFDSITNDREAWEVVVDWYKKHYGDIESYVDWSGKEHKGSWIDILQTYVDVVHMQRWEHDAIDVRAVLLSYGILEESDVQ